MALSRVAGGTTGESTSGLTHSFTIGTVLDNDWLICAFPYASGSRVVTQTAGPTLTEIGAPGAAQSGATLRVYKRKLVAADSASTFTLTNDGAGLKAAMSWIIIRGANSTDIVGDFATGTLGTGTAHVAPPIAASAAYGTPLVIMSDVRGGSTPNTSAWTVPAGFTKDSEGFATGTVALVSSVLAYATGFASIGSGTAVNPGTFNADQSAFANAYTLILRPPNVPPVASAGVDQVAAISQLVTLAGDDTDEDGTITGRAWTQTGGATVTLTGGTTKTPTFTPTVAGTYTFRYTVTDSGGASSFDDVGVFVSTTTPRPVGVVANAGWTNVGGAADLAAALADESDTTYAESGASPAGSSFTVGMDRWAVGQESWNAKVAKSDSSTNIDCLLELLCGTTVVDSVTVSLTTTPTTTATRTLTSTQRALITDRNAMRLRFTATTV